MNWMLVSSVAEVVTATGMIGSLIYVGMEIRQATRAVHASSIDAHVASISFVREQLATNSELASIYMKGLADPESLSDTEHVRFRVLMFSIFWASWNAYAQTKLSRLSSTSIELFESQKPLLSRLLSAPGGRWFWKEHSKEFDEPFKGVIEETVNANNRP